MTRWKAEDLSDNMLRKMKKEDRQALGVDGITEEAETDLPEPELLIGIDPGTDTGLSVYDPDKENLIAVKSGTFIVMGVELLQWHSDHKIRARIEDARQRTWFGKKPRTQKEWDEERGKLQGVGSVKRDCKLWEEFCEYYGIEYEMVHPIKGATKLDAKTFKKMTKWEGQTNEHKRDSAMLVYGL